MLVRRLGIAVDVVPYRRVEFDEEKHEVDTLARAAFLRGRRVCLRSLASAVGSVSSEWTELTEAWQKAQPNQQVASHFLR